MHDTGWPKCADRRCLNIKLLFYFSTKTQAPSLWPTPQRGSTSGDLSLTLMSGLKWGSSIGSESAAARPHCRRK